MCVASDCDIFMPKVTEGLVHCVMESPGLETGEECCRFRKNRSQSNQIFVLGKLCNKVNDKRRLTCVVLMVFNKANDEVNIEALCHELDF